MADTRKDADGDSETLLAREEPRGNVLPPAPPRRRVREIVASARRAPFVELALYYLLFIAVLAVLAHFVDDVRKALLTPSILQGASKADILRGGAAKSESVHDLNEALHRLWTTLVVIAGALALVVPVARVYMRTKRFRYDPALVRSVIILPIVVAGISMVVKNSIALAFSLAGIVAAVRFRNTLKDPRDAVYVFLAIGIGLSAGVQALDVALAMSMAFNFVVLGLWRWNIGSIYGGRYGQTGILSVGDPALLVAQTPAQQRTVRRQALELDPDIRSDGILLVHSTGPDLARTTVQEALSDMARDWVLMDVIGRGDGMSTLQYAVRMKKGTAPTDLVGALDERWSSQVAAAEYVPFRTRKKKRKA